MLSARKSVPRLEPPPMTSSAPIHRAKAIRAPILLCADDYGLTRSISEAILRLASGRRLSATSAIVTGDRWALDAKAISGLRDRVAIGLHLNLTEGRPLGRMPGLAQDGNLPALRTVLTRALTGSLDNAELSAEIDRQLDQFERELGAPPDFLDGHQHVHVLPGIRRAVIETLLRRNYRRPFLLRNPSNRAYGIGKHQGAAGKAYVVAGLATGFGRLASKHGFRVNQGFSGFSTFGGLPYSVEFESFLVAADRGHMVMCHPGLGYPDDGAGDPLNSRRLEEYELLIEHPAIIEMIWHPVREGGSLDWML